MTQLIEDLENQFAESDRLQKQIQSNLSELSQVWSGAHVRSDKQ
jgi:hypothetical protein